MVMAAATKVREDLGMVWKIGAHGHPFWKWQWLPTGAQLPPQFCQHFVLSELGAAMVFVGPMLAGHVKTLEWTFGKIQGSHLRKTK